MKISGQNIEETSTSRICRTKSNLQGSSTTFEVSSTQEYSEVCMLHLLTPPPHTKIEPL